MASLRLRGENGRGSDAIEYARDQLQSRLAELEAWAELSTSTDHDDAR
jgi:hypothetical protein